MMIALLKLNFIFFHNNSKKQQKEADTNFVLLSWSTSTIGRFMKIYLHRRIEILQFLTGRRTHKCLTV